MPLNQRTDNFGENGKVSAGSSHMSVSGLKAKDNRLSYCKHCIKAFNSLHSLLIQKIITDTASLNIPFIEELKLLIEN
jgi:hypothetical protein